MSDQVDVASIITYQREYSMIAQQFRSKLLNLVNVEHEQGERTNFPQVGVVAARKRTQQHEPTNYINSPHFRRWVDPEVWDLGDLIDEPDLRKIVANPAGPYSMAFIAALNRARDTEIVEKMLGVNYVGKSGTTQESAPTNSIPHGGTGFTLSKVEDAMDYLVGDHHDPQEDNIQLCIAWTRKQERAFLATAEVKSIDYNTQKVLVDGGMGGNKFYGFYYVRLQDWVDQDGVTHQILPKSGTTRTCVAWVKNHIYHNEWVAPRVRITQESTLKFSWQVFADAMFGTTRGQPGAVVPINVVES